MTRKVPIIKKYSSAFKQKIVKEVESGILSINQAMKIYDITGSNTIKNWLKKFGIGHLVSKVIKIEMNGEESTVKKLRKENSQLESALAKSMVENMALKTLVELAESEYGIDLKKNSGKNVSTSARKKSRRKRRKP